MTASLSSPTSPSETPSQRAAGRITRVDPKTGATTTYATGLPKPIIGLGGAMDIAFIAGTAYVLVTLVGPDVGRLESAPRRRDDQRGPDGRLLRGDDGAVYTIGAGEHMIGE